MKLPKVVNIRKAELNKRGIDDFSKWKKKSKSVYIGRNMSFYIKGATQSKWANPFTVKKYGPSKCLKLYRKYIKKTPELYDNLEELLGKELGCFCHPDPCHGDVLVELLKEKLEEDEE